MTDAFGSVSEGVLAQVSGSRWSQWTWQDIEAWPARGEEAEISDSTEVLVFRSAYVLTGDATIEDGRARFEGTVDRVAMARLQKERDAAPVDEGEGFDPRGDPVADAAVTAVVTELIPVRTQTGTVYDFTPASCLPTGTASGATASTFDLVSGSDGSFELGRGPSANGYTVT
jgi:hypothetical protein